jgi:outer membrane lipoprotein SlyB
MDTSVNTPDASGGKRGILYPAMLIAAISVIVFSILGIATMTGLIPSARSQRDTAAVEPSARMAPAAVSPAPRIARPQVAAADCADCGVVESIRAVQTQGQASGLGAVAGGVVGGILGNQVGGGRGRTAMTVLGAGAGAYAGHEIEKNMNKAVRYQVRVRMQDGTSRTFYETSPPAFSVGQKVRVTHDGIIAVD